MAVTVTDRVAARALVLAIDPPDEAEAIESLIAAAAGSAERLGRAARLVQHRNDERPSIVRARAVRLLQAGARMAADRLPADRSAFAAEATS
ncbi:MAG: hypothetical protein S0880_13765 [Actinomycetota bacterium]|nr:hypothetical protein [Actinomycetota bacterium]